MRKKQTTKTMQHFKLKPKLYAIQTEKYDFSTSLVLLEKQLGFYPGTLLRNPIAFDHLTILENILWAYAIAHPKQRNKERIVTDMLEEHSIDIDFISNHSFHDLSLHTSLNMQLFIYFLCDTKVILVDDWLNHLPDYELNNMILLFKSICQKQDVTILLYTEDERVKARCDEFLFLDELYKKSS